MHNNKMTRIKTKKALETGIILTLLLFTSYCVTYEIVSSDSCNSSSTIDFTAEPGQEFVLRSSAPPVVTLKVIVILAELADASHSKTQMDINSTIFTDMRLYFENVSYGRMTITGNVTSWQYIANNTAEYGRDTGLWPNGIDDVDGDGIADSWWLIQDAIHKVTSTVNFAQYDHVIVVHSGQDQSLSDVRDDIWSAQYTGLEIASNNGVIIRTGVIISELDPLGVFAHEFGHELGLPDLYNINRSPDNYVGPWDLMSEGALLNNGASPSDLTSWCKIQLGWVSGNSVTVGRALQGVIDPIEILGANLTAMKIPITTQTYYLVEVRQQGLGRDTSIPSGGVLILYCDESRASGEGIVVVQLDSRTLNQAPFNENAGRNMLVDDARNVNITVVTAYSQSYKVSVNLIRGDSTPPYVDVFGAVPVLWPTSTYAIVRAVITDTGASSSSVKNATLVYSSDSGQSWNRVNMTPGMGDVYSASIPPENSFTVQYYIEAYDYAGNLAIANNGGSYYSYYDTLQVLLIVALISVGILLVSYVVIRRVRRPKAEEVEVRVLHSPIGA